MTSVHADSASTALPFVLGLDGAQVIAAVSSAELRAALAESGAAAIVVGLDRISSQIAPAASGLEPTVAVAALAHHLPEIAFLAVGSPHRDHPFNLARRSASLDHIGAGRTGLLLGTRNRTLTTARGEAAGDPVERPHDRAWEGTGGDDAVVSGPASTADAARAIRELWQSWPSESIIADRAARIFVQSERIVHVDHHGPFEIAGPLNVPSTPQGSPVLAWYVQSPDELALALLGADLVVLAEADALPAEAEGTVGGPLRYLEIALGADAPADALTTQIGSAVAGGADGVLLAFPGRSGAALIESLLSIPASAALRRTVADGTLRSRLDLGAAEPLLQGARSAFPAVRG